MAEWSIASDCKSDGLSPTQVQILPGAQQTKEPNVKTLGDFVCSFREDLKDGSGIQDDEVRGGLVAESGSRILSEARA